MGATDLKQMTCEPCRRGGSPVSDGEKAAWLRELPGWRIVLHQGVERLEKVFTFPDFAAALAFTNRVGELAEAQDHHPALLTEWGQVTVSWWTHKIGGLHRNDFIMAAHTDSV